MGELGVYNGEVSKRVEICAAHWLPFHKGKCQHLHGHNYIFDVSVYGLFQENIASDAAFVIDFGDLKQVINDTIMEWDHALLTHYTGEQLEDLFAIGPIPEWGLSQEKVIPLGCWSTAENLSRIAAEVIASRLSNQRQVLAVSVTCWETSNSSARHSLTTEAANGY